MILNEIDFDSVESVQHINNCVTEKENIRKTLYNLLKHGAIAGALDNKL